MLREGQRVDDLEVSLSSRACPLPILVGSWCWWPHPSESRAPRRCWGGADYCRAPRRARQVASCCASCIPLGEQRLAMHSQLRAAHLNHVCMAYLPQSPGCPSPGRAAKAQAFLREGELPGCHREFCNGTPRPFLREQSPGWKWVVHSSQQPISSQTLVVERGGRPS